MTPINYELSKCLWVLNDDDYYGKVWEPRCGDHPFKFSSDSNNDTPAENEFKFCPFCGNEIVTEGEIDGQQPL